MRRTRIALLAVLALAITRAAWVEPASASIDPDAPYAYPTSSWVGPMLFDPNGGHTGADLWGNQSGAGSVGPSVYAAAGGTIAHIWWLCWNVVELKLQGPSPTACSPGMKYGVTIQMLVAAS